MIHECGLYKQVNFVWFELSGVSFDCWYWNFGEKVFGFRYKNKCFEVFAKRVGSNLKELLMHMKFLISFIRRTEKQAV